MPHAENNPSLENKLWPATRPNVEELLLTWVLSGLRRLKLSVALLNGMKALRETGVGEGQVAGRSRSNANTPQPMLPIDLRSQLTVGENARGQFIIDPDLRCHLKERQTTAVQTTLER